VSEQRSSPGIQDLLSIGAICGVMIGWYVATRSARRS
jgi:hypothetical protein